MTSAIEPDDVLECDVCGAPLVAESAIECEECGAAMCSEDCEREHECAEEPEI